MTIRLMKSLALSDLDFVVFPAAGVPVASEPWIAVEVVMPDVSTSGAAADQKTDWAR